MHTCQTTGKRYAGTHLGDLQYTQISEPLLIVRVLSPLSRLPNGFLLFSPNSSFFRFQIITSPSLAPPLRELRRLIRLRLGQVRDMVGYDIAAMRLLSRTANAKREQWSIMDDTNGTAQKDVWSGLGLGSDLAAALEGRRGGRGGGKKK